jgi:hypothetical protein
MDNQTSGFRDRLRNCLRGTTPNILPSPGTAASHLSHLYATDKEAKRRYSYLLANATPGRRATYTVLVHILQLPQLIPHQVLLACVI